MALTGEGVAFLFVTPLRVITLLTDFINRILLVIDGLTLIFAISFLRFCSSLPY